MPLPRVDALAALYAGGTQVNEGEVVMIGGRSGTQKSGFAIWYCDAIDVPVLYVAGDMEPATAAKRLASCRTGLTADEIEQIMSTDGPERDALEENLQQSKITWAFGQPIKVENIAAHVDAGVEIYDQHFKVIVLDNLMDCEGAEADYKAQMAYMQIASQIARDTGATVIVLHHASDKSWEASTDPWNPPSRKDIKNGLAEKPGLTLTVALDPYSMKYRIATVKNRTGPCDPSGRTFITLICEPELTRFHHPWNHAQRGET